MVMQDNIIIQLDKYGIEGYMSIGYPSMRKLLKAKQLAASKLVRISSDGKATVDSSTSVESDFLMNVLPYIEEAPIAIESMDDFFDLTDQMDAKRRGAGEEFFDEVLSAVKRVKGGEISPSAGSQAAETVSSE